MNLDHIDGLDDAGGEHTRGTAIDEGLHSGPDTGGFRLLLVSHLLDSEDSEKLNRERERGERKIS